VQFFFAFGFLANFLLGCAGYKIPSLSLEDNLGSAFSIKNLKNFGSEHVYSYNDLHVYPVKFEMFHGWEQDDHVEAFKVFVKSCQKLALQDSKVILNGIGGKAQHWHKVCKQASSVIHPSKNKNYSPDPIDTRAFFQNNFVPVFIPRDGSIPDGKSGLLTGYYEPILKGSRVRSAWYNFPIYRLPEKLKNSKTKYYSRKAIDEGALDERSLEMLYLKDPVETYFLHIQGSGIIQLDDGTTVRVGYAGKNGHKYNSIGQWLIKEGYMDAKNMTAEGLKDFLRKNSYLQSTVFAHNPSYIFFRYFQFCNDFQLSQCYADGPVGAQGVPLVSMRSLAIDKKYYSFGMPVWLEASAPGGGNLNRLMIAQDTGSAIRGAQRADFFWGSGEVSKYPASMTREPLVLIALVPKEGFYETAKKLP
jgi:membrane-bound lytic murein transglycosylase A